jgi:hypothetical protein
MMGVMDIQPSAKSALPRKEPILEPQADCLGIYDLIKAGKTPSEVACLLHSKHLVTQNVEVIQNNSSNLNSIVNHALRVMGNSDEVVRWLMTPIDRLSYGTPIWHLRTKEGVAYVNAILDRDDHSPHAWPSDTFREGTVKTHIAVLALLLILSGCQKHSHNVPSRTYTPTELWDAMLGSKAQEGHMLAQTGPELLSYIRIKGKIDKIEPPNPMEKSPQPALIFSVDRTTMWNGLTLRGSVRAPINPTAHFQIGQDVSLVCQVGAGAMPYVYMLRCE